MPLHFIKQLPAQIMLFQQMTEAAHCRLVRHRLAAEIDADKIANGCQIIDRFLHRRVRQVEPLLQEIDAQHPLDPDRRAAIARLGVDRLDKPPQRRPRNHSLHLSQKYRPPRRVAVTFKPRSRQRQLLHCPNLRAPIHLAAHYITITGRGFCRGSLAGSPPGERPNPHALPPAISATAYLGIPAGPELIKALMPGLLSAIAAEVKKALGSVVQRNFVAPCDIRVCPAPISEHRKQPLPAV